MKHIYFHFHFIFSYSFSLIYIIIYIVITVYIIIESVFAYCIFIYLISFFSFFIHSKFSAYSFIIKKLIYIKKKLMAVNSTFSFSEQFSFRLQMVYLLKCTQRKQSRSVLLSTTAHACTCNLYSP